MAVGLTWIDTAQGVAAECGRAFDDITTCDLSNAPYGGR